MRGRTRELCREANDSQNWFADNANGKGRNPRIVLRVREYSAFAKENFAWEKEAASSSSSFTTRVNSRPQFCVGFYARGTSA